MNRPGVPPCTPYLPAFFILPVREVATNWGVRDWPGGTHPASAPPGQRWSHWVATSAKVWVFFWAVAVAPPLLNPDQPFQPRRRYKQQSSIGILIKL